MSDPIADALERARTEPAFQMFSLPTEYDSTRALRLDKERADVASPVFNSPGERVSAGLELELTTNAVQSLAESTIFPYDPTYVAPAVDTPEFKRLTNNIPAQLWPRLGRANSATHAEMIKNDILTELEAEDKLARDGWSGTSMRVAAAVLDPVTLASLLSTPGAAFLVRGGRLERAAKFAAAGGAANLALESALYNARETKSYDDLYYALVGGLVAGGALGAALPVGSAAKMSAAGKRILAGEESDNAPLEAISLSLDEDLSVGAAQATRGADALSTEKIPLEAIETPQLKGVEAKLRFDWYGSLAKSDNPYIRRAGNLLLSDPVNGQVGFAAEEFATLIKKKALTKFYQQANPALNEALAGVSVSARASAADSFFEGVTAAVRLGNFTDTATGRAARAMSEAITDTAKEAKRLGVKGFENLDLEDGYVPRIINPIKVETLVQRFGNQQIEKLFATAFAKATGVELKYAAKIAKGYIRNIRLRGAGVESDFSLALADKNILSELMSKAGIPESEIKETLEAFAAIGEKDSTKAGKIARAKRRLDIDETFSAKLKDKAGVEATISVSDLFENDARILTRLYISSVGGHAALAKAGFTSRAEWDAFLRQAALSEADTGRARGNAVHTEISKLQKAYDVITGKPLIDYNDPLNALSHVVRDWAYVAQSGMFGFAQASELAQVLTTGGVRMTLRTVPEMKGIFTRAADGKLSNELARELEEFVAPGTDALLHSTLNRYANDYDEAFIPQAKGILAKTERVRHTASKISGYISGLTPITVAMQRLESRFVAQRIVNSAFGKGRTWSPDRLSSMGLDGDIKHKVFDQIKKYAITQPGAEAGTFIRRLDLQKWDDLDARDAFVLAVQRETNKSVLTPTLGASLSVVHSSELAKVLTQFMTFAVQSHSRLLLHGVKYMDAERSIAWLTGTALAGLAYAGRTQLESIGKRDRDKFLRERMSPDRIASAAFNMSGYSALLPMVVDTTLAVTPGADPIFSHARTSGLGTSLTDLGRYPAGAIVQGLGNTLTAAKDGRLTQAEHKQALRMLPFSRVIGIQQALNILGSELPAE